LSKRYHGVPSNLLVQIGLEFWMPAIYLRCVPFFRFTDCSDKKSFL
jgi:hypothetical protein